MAQSPGKHFRFLGTPSQNGEHDAIGYEFEGRKPVFVTGPAVDWFAGNPLYEEVRIHPLDRDENGEKGGSKPKARRKAKAK